MDRKRFFLEFFPETPKELMTEVYRTYPDVVPKLPLDSPRLPMLCKIWCTLPHVLFDLIEASREVTAAVTVYKTNMARLFYFYLHGVVIDLYNQVNWLDKNLRRVRMELLGEMARTMNQAPTHLLEGWVTDAKWLIRGSLDTVYSRYNRPDPNERINLV